MSRPPAQTAVKSPALLVLSVVLAACGGPAAPQPAPAPPAAVVTDHWTLQEAMQIPLQKSASTTMPVIQDWPRGGATTLANYHVWDSWPLRKLDGSVATIPGPNGQAYYLMVHLSVPKTVLPGDRHDLAQLRYSYSTDGKSWQGGELLFPEGTVIGSRNWAGSAVLADDGKIYVFYTATGEKGETVGDPPVSPSRAHATDIDSAQLQNGRLRPEHVRPQSGSGFPQEGDVSFEQRLVVAHGATPSIVNGHLKFEGTWKHKVVVRADGTLYQTVAQSDVGPLYGFRDPWVFRDPSDGRLHMIFTANVGGT